ncbi:hypothetical protein HPMBJEAJ_00428 [Aeromonas phage avDM6]|nr:hypothetical protein HPMBJEAJ_00428 [Aeromonas phage avDM6]
MTYEEWVEQNQDFLIRYIKENISLWVGVDHRDSGSSISTKVSVSLYDVSEHDPLTTDYADAYFQKD